MSNHYIVINIGEGDIYMETMSAEKLAARLNDEDFGKNPTFLTQPPNSWMNLMESAGGYYIIKGEFVTPRAKEVVTQWEV